MTHPSIQELDVQGKRVLIRVDYNVPINEAGAISDDTRIRLTLPTIEYLLKRGARLILMSHFGRPKGKVDLKYSLKPCAERLSKLIGKPVKFAPDCVGQETEELVEDLGEGDILLLENLRFHEGEEHPEKDPQFAKELAKLGDVYVNDAFGAAHRSHASITAVTELFPWKKAVGFLMEKELSYLSKLVINPKRPFYAIVGGAKIGTKLGVFKALEKKVDAIFIGGGMAYTFFKAKKISIGNSICEDAFLEEAQKFLEACKKDMIQVHFPIDCVITDGKEIKTILMKEGIPEGWEGMDVGPQTIESWSEILHKGATIFWNGPVGVFEKKEFAEGTSRLAKNLSEMPASVIVGGGDSLAAVHNLGIEKKFTHLSSGGGASLEFIEHGTLPGIEKLHD